MALYVLLDPALPAGNISMMVAFRRSPVRVWIILFCAKQRGRREEPMTIRSVQGKVGSQALGAGTPAWEINVVHSCYGRLRVLLRHWSRTRADEIVDAIRRLHGVTDASANVLTGNALILFEPRKTSARALIDTLPALRLDTASEELPAEQAGRYVPQPGQALSERPPIVYMIGPGRVVYRALGWSSVAMAAVGAITPGIPTAPFVVLAGYFFVRSSPEAHQWLRQARWFGPILRDWEEHRAVRRSLRNAALGLIVLGMGVTAVVGLPTVLTATIIMLQIAGVAIVLSLPVVDSDTAVPAGANQ
jgi:uncharacterized protein